MLITDPHSRRFGVEIECGLPGGTQRAREMFCRNEDGYDYGGWSVDYDGSGVEVRTPILQGESGFNTLRDAMERLKEAGAYVTNADGLHVHHDAPDFDGNHNRLLQLVTSWRNNESSIHEMVAPRRRNNGCCPAWEEDEFRELVRWSEVREGVRAPARDPYGYSESEYLNLDCRNDLNLTSLYDHGSIELRLHEGTLDADVAIAWIQFGQSFLHEIVTRTSPMREMASDTTLLSNIRLSPAARQILAEKKRLGHITEASKYRTRINPADREDYEPW